MQIDNQCAIDALTAVVDLLETGGTVTVQVWDNTAAMPSELTTAPTSVLLATLTCTAGTGAFGAPFDNNPGARVNAAAITDDGAADADGTVSFYRILDGGGTARIQGPASATGGGGEAQFNKAAFVADDVVSLTELYLVMPES